MIVLHAGSDGVGLLLWGETPSPAEAAGAKRGTASLPFAASAQALQAALPAPSSVVTRLVWLPTVDGQPLASSPLIAEPPPGKKTAALVPWHVPAVRLALPQVIDLLCRCLDRELLAPGVIVGKTLAYWAQVLRFASALVAREQFLPDVAEEDGSLRAVWKPVIAGTDATRFEQLVQAMPPICRALGTQSKTPPETPGRIILAHTLDAFVDALVRGSAPAAYRGQLDSLHDHWLYALRSAKTDVKSDPEERETLLEQVQQWQRPITVLTAAPFRLCFRLEEPATENHSPALATAETWQVRYLLQARDDPSLLLPVAEAWNPTGRRAAIFKRKHFEPKEYLFTALGQAAALCPGVEQSLQEAAPGGFALSTLEAFTFLREQASVLEQAGFGVLLPAWWSRKGTKQRLSMKAKIKTPKMSGGSGLTLEDLVQFDWEVALGEQKLTRKELELLAQLKSPLVKVRGQWVQMSAEEIQAALDFWRNRQVQETTVRDAMLMALGAGQAPGGLAFEGVEATGWMREFLDQLQGRTAFEEEPPPGGFQGTLRPYQQRGYSWLSFLRQWGLGACLADDMGLGKTVQTLALLQRHWNPADPQPTLLICPMSVVGNWQKEAARFTPELPVMVHHGLKRQKDATFVKEAGRHALVLSSYALLYRDVELFRQVPWAGIILDEAQNIKNPETKQAQAARSLKADTRIALTGTPVENHVGDLWSVMEFLNPGFLGTQAGFRRNFFLPIQAERDAGAMQKLQRLTGPFLLRRLKTDKSIIADLPDKLEMKVFCTLTKEQASLYAAVVKEADEAIRAADGIQRKGVVLATLAKLKQVCNHPAHFLGDNSPLPGRSGKLERLTEMLEEALAAGDKALLFTQFTEMGDLLKKHLQETFGQEVLFLHGGVAKKQRDRLVERFQQEDDGPKLFLLSLKAGGTGLNLTAANHVFHFDRWWNPAVENQATDRAFRIGQKRNVQVHKFLCAGTFEEKIDEMIESKQQVAAQVVGTGEGWLTALSNDQLRDLFTLRKEAIGE